MGYVTFSCFKGEPASGRLPKGEYSKNQYFAKEG